MLEYIEKYNRLPKEVRDKLSGPEVMAAIEDLENKYKTDLVSFVIRVAIKEIPAGEMSQYLINEHSINEADADSLAKDLMENVFYGVKEHLALFEGAENRLGDTVKQSEIKDDSPLLSPKAPLTIKTEKNPALHSPFYFSAEDEEDVKNISAKFAHLPQQDDHKSKIDGYIDELIREVNIHFSSEATSSRFRQILKTYFLGIRDRLSTKVTFAKTYDSGGLSLDEKTIEMVLGAADNKIKTLKEKGIALEDALLAGKKLTIEGPRDIDYDLKRELEQGNIKKREEVFTLNALDTSHEIAPPHPAEVKTPSVNVFPQVENKAVGIKAHNGKTPEAPKKTAVDTAFQEPIIPTDKIVAFSRPADSGKKIKMDDVVFVPKEKKETSSSVRFVMGPIDELKNMDTTSFRRLARDPKAACEKIREKIQLLQDEDYGKKLEGIKGWRTSPIYRLYLAIGQESILEKKSVSEILLARQRAGKDSLSQDEFDAIMDINKALRF